MPRLFVACVPSASSRALPRGGRRAPAPSRRPPCASSAPPISTSPWPSSARRPRGSRGRAPRGGSRRSRARSDRSTVPDRGAGRVPDLPPPRAIWAGLESGPTRRRCRRSCASGSAARASRSGARRPRGGRSNPTSPSGGSVREARAPAVPLPRPLEMLLTAGALQGTYTPELLSDLLLMVSEATSLSDIELGASDPDAGRPASGLAASGLAARAWPGTRLPGSRYRVLASWCFAGGIGGGAPSGGASPTAPA